MMDKESIEEKYALSRLINWQGIGEKSDGWTERLTKLLTDSTITDDKLPTNFTSYREIFAYHESNKNK